MWIMFPPIPIKRPKCVKGSNNKWYPYEKHRWTTEVMISKYNVEEKIC